MAMHDPPDRNHDHGGGHAHGRHGRRHGNPEDLDAYVGRMESPERLAWQRPDDVIRCLGLRRGDTVADLGAGPGWFTVRLARAVGPAGRVFAVDVEPEMLALLRKRVEQAGAGNVTPVLARPGDPLLPPESCDLILVLNAFHHFPDGRAYLERLKGHLTPRGRIANIDFHARELPVGPPVEEKIAREDFLATAEAAGLDVEREETFLEHQYFVVLRPR